MNLQEKILKRIEVTPSGCWEWQGARNSAGYGRIWDGKAVGYCHRIMAGAIKGKVVMHSCDNPACCNPEHLSLGTHKENSQDMVNKGRSRRGYKLSDADVLAIMESSESGVKLAATYGVSRTTIYYIRNGRRHGRLRRQRH